MKPTRRPRNPCFSSGPCAKRPGWSPAALEAALVGRSHRSGLGKARIVEVIDRSRAILGIPADWQVGIVAASDTGAVEIALWSLLGRARRRRAGLGEFRRGLGRRTSQQLKLADVRVLHAPYGRLPDLRQVDPDRDVVFPWNGTTSGVRVPNGDWIAADRQGLTICDATSAVFAMRLPWDKLDVVTWSWQKALGGEAAHGMLALVAARGRAARELHPALAAAQAVPADLEGQADRGRLPGRDHQHAVDAVRRGRARTR